MTEMLENLGALSPAAWAAGGIVVSKLAEYLMSRGRETVDHTKAAYEAVQVSQKQLHDSMFQQMKVMQEQVDGLRKQVVESISQLNECEEQHRASSKRVDELQREVDQFLRAMPGH